MNHVTIIEPDTTAVAAEASAVAAEADAIVVSDAATHEAALNFVARVTRAGKAVRDLFAGPKKAAHDAHKSICAAETKLTAPLDAARATVEPRITAYVAAERRRAEEAARAAEAEARKAEEDRLIAEAAAAEADGHHDAAATIVAQPIVTPYIAPRPAVATVAGVAARVTYSAQVDDLAKLIKYVAENVAERSYLLVANETAINGLARSQREQLNIPGVRVIKKDGLSVR